MKTRVYLTLTKNGVVNMTKQAPKLGRGQRAVRIEISVPDSAFTDPPVLDASLDIPADLLIAPAHSEPLTVEVWK